MAAISNLYIDAGSNFSVIVTVRGSDGTPLNLNGYNVKSQMRKSYGSTVAHDFVATVYDANSGKIRLQMPASTSSSIKPGRYLYDIEIMQGSDTTTKTRVVEGLVIMTPEITKT